MCYIQIQWSTYNKRQQLNIAKISIKQTYRIGVKGCCCCCGGGGGDYYIYSLVLWRSMEVTHSNAELIFLGLSWQMLWFGGIIIITLKFSASRLLTVSSLSISFSVSLSLLLSFFSSLFISSWRTVICVLLFIMITCLNAIFFSSHFWFLTYI